MRAPVGVQELLRPGESGISGRSLLGLGRVALTTTIVLTNLIGAAAVLGIALFVVPMPHVPGQEHVRLLNGLVAAVYLALALPGGAIIGTRGLLSLRVWLGESRPANAAEKRQVLHAPARLFAVQMALWLVAAAVFGTLDATYSTPLAERVAVIVILTGLVTASCAYLLTEILLRPVAARALADGHPEGVSVPGVATRSLLAWLIGTGLPLAGLIATGVLALSGDPSATRHQLGLAMVGLGGIGLAVGLLAVTVAARATADPVASVSRALGRVRRGDFAVKVPVYDGTQIGQLQTGFNEMAAGLAERERIRELFGAYVDPDVAERVLSDGVDVAGERVEVTVMFLDVRDFTGFVERTRPEEVLSALNALFERAVKIIQAHDGRVDKFVGDGLLAVFGAPRRRPDHAEQALQAAREIIGELEGEHRAEAPAAPAAEGASHDGARLRVGIGLDSGEVLAGNVGGAGRLEFTVIGDTVNVASRVEAATRETGDPILLTAWTRERLGSSLQAGLASRGEVKLKGRSESVELFAAEPAGDAVAESPASG